jgi:hypothetical protein
MGLKYKNFLFFTTFFSLEKGLLWVFPLFFLYQLNNENIYSQLELILSITAIINVIIDFGLNIYASYSFKRRGLSSFQLSFSTILIILSFLACIVFLYQIAFGFKVIIIIIFCRLIYFSLYRFMITYYRWNRNPILPVFINIVLYCFCMIILYLIDHFKVYFDYNLNSKIILKFLSYFYFLGFLIFLYILTKHIKILINETPKFFINCLQYSWPLVLLTVLNMSLPNLAKIFSYARDVSLMSELSQILRFCIVIQLFHGAFFTFFYKKIFQEMDFFIIKKYIVFYTFLMILASFVCFAFLNIVVNFDFKVITIGIFYTFFWCLSSFFELFFSRVAKNILILYGGLIALSTYLSLYIFLKPDNVINNLVILLITSIVYMTYLIYNIYINRKVFFETT